MAESSCPSTANCKSPKTGGLRLAPVKLVGVIWVSGQKTTGFPPPFMPKAKPTVQFRNPVSACLPVLAGRDDDVVLLVQHRLSRGVLKLSCLPSGSP